MPWNEGTLRRTPTYESSWTKKVSSSASTAVHKSNVATRRDASSMAHRALVLTD